MKIPLRTLWLALPVLLLLLGSCKATRHLKEGEYLLKKNVVQVDGENVGIDKEEVTLLLKPQRNKRFLFIFPLKVWFYNIGMQGKTSSGFRTWFREKAGEAPVAADSLIADEAIESVISYLNKTGFFDSEVSHHTIKRNFRRRAISVFTIHPSVPYRIRNYEHELEDSTLLYFTGLKPEDAIVKPGNIFNAFKLEDERERITEQLRNNGYFYFNRNFIYFEIDSAVGGRQIDVFMKIKPSQAPGDTNVLNAENVTHHRYYINNIYINPAFDQLNKKRNDLDTVKITIPRGRHKENIKDYYFLYAQKLKIHPKIITQSIFINTHHPYNSKDQLKTQQRLRELGLFGHVSIYFKDVTGKTKASPAQPHRLDAYLDLSRRKLNSFSVEGEGTNKSGRLGIGGNISFTNNNLFRGAEIFRIRLRGSLEFQRFFGNDDEDQSAGTSPVNTIETGIEFSIDFPKFLIPIRQERFPKYFKPKTILGVGISFEKRPEYTRSINNLTFGYDWRQSETKTHQLFPFDISMVDVSPTPEFQEIIDNEPNERIRNQYEDHLIFGLNYNFIFNNQNIQKLKNFFYFRGHIEPAGNLLSLIANASTAPKDSLGHYQIFGVPYAQYLKMDGDFRYYYVISKNSSLVFRFFAGVAAPYGNADVLPLERGYYGGGANGMRGWPYRRLGPGGYSNDNDNYDRMGEIQLETNLEYRFTVYKWFKMALFTDVGNIWFMDENESYPQGSFYWNTFASQLAMDAGIGLRFDFNFFVLRLDNAVKVRDPAQASGERWVLNKVNFNGILVNLGIGYPF